MCSAHCSCCLVRFAVEFDHCICGWSFFRFWFFSPQISLIFQFWCLNRFVVVFGFVWSKFVSLVSVFEIWFLKFVVESEYVFRFISGFPIVCRMFVLLFTDCSVESISEFALFSPMKSSDDSSVFFSIPIWCFVSHQSPIRIVVRCWCCDGS